MGYKGEKSASGKTSRRLRTEDKYKLFCRNPGLHGFTFANGTYLNTGLGFEPLPFHVRPIMEGGRPERRGTAG